MYYINQRIYSVSENETKKEANEDDASGTGSANANFCKTTFDTILIFVVNITPK